MQVAYPNIDWTASALFLDVDGTLLELEEHPDDVRADAALISELQHVFNILDGALALVSGRSLSEIERIFSPARFPAAGAHGAEYLWCNDRIEIKDTPALPSPVVRAAEEFAKSHRGLLLEYKRSGIALHYRRAPTLESASRTFMADIHARCAANFRLVEGKAVLELTSGTHTKGTAISEFLARPPYLGRVPVFVGDDVTDEDGFQAANSLSGTSIQVGNCTESAAKFALEDVAAVRRWLQTIGRD